MFSFPLHFCGALPEAQKQNPLPIRQNKDLTLTLAFTGHDLKHVFNPRSPNNPTCQELTVYDKHSA